MPMQHYNPQQYKQGGNTSTIGTQLVDFYFIKEALTDQAKERYFGQLADTTAMPKNHGKTIKRYHLVGVLNDENINDQGIDATGSAVANEVTITIVNPDNMIWRAVGTSAASSATAASDALASARSAAMDVLRNLRMPAAIAPGATYAAVTAGLIAAGWQIIEGSAVPSFGNLYGSSKDIGVITSKFPLLSETGGRVNRFGFTRKTLEATIENYGLFEEYTEDSVQFDTDPELRKHAIRESTKAANELVEALLQIDLLNGAGIVMYGGEAMSASELTGNDGATPSVVSYRMLRHLDTILNRTRAPKDSKIITGSRMTDTRVVGAVRYILCGDEVKTSLLKMLDFHGKPAFIEIQHYADASTLANGEIGAIGKFRFIEVPEMFHWDGAGAPATNNGTTDHLGNQVSYRESNGRYNVYPLLYVGAGSFTNIGFQTSGKSMKFRIYHKAPGLDTADRTDPFGKMGFYSIQFWHGTMILRPEWIALIKVVAEN